MSDARAEMLARIRAATATAAPLPPGPPAGPAEPGDAVAPPAATEPDRPTGGRAPAGPGESVARFVERVEEYGGSVTRAAEHGVAAAVGVILTRHGARRLAVAPGLPTAWLPGGGGIELLTDGPPLAVAVLDGVDGALTGSAVAVAETGTVALDGSAPSGRRALSLVPDLHICVVRGGDIVAGVPEGIARLGEAVRAGRPITLVSGPSATSDIELSRVEGVHGPRRLEIVLVI